jgi:hypothetical protein
MSHFTRGGDYSIVGIADAGASFKRPPDFANDPRWQSWPTHVTVPKSFRGSGRPVDVRRCFEEAFTMVLAAGDSRKNPRCDTYFHDLGQERAPKMRRTLSDLLGYKLIFYRYGAANPADDFKVTGGQAGVTSGQVLSTNNVSGVAIISISAYAARSPTSLAATIIHELAHVAGAPGAPSDEDWASMDAKRRLPYFGAENALKFCGFSHQHNAEIYGEVLEHFQHRMNIRGLA